MKPDHPAAAPGDEELVQRALDGDSTAFDLLVERHQRRAVSVSYRLLGDLHDALEVSQEAFLRAYRNLPTLESPARFGAWLLRIVTNLSLNFRRSRSTGGPRLSLEDCLLDEGRSENGLLADTNSSDERPGAQLAELELREALQSALAELPQQQRTALVLFSMEQLPQKDVAEIMGLSVEAVKWHVFQARRKLRERLADFIGE